MSVVVILWFSGSCKKRNETVEKWNFHLCITSLAADCNNPGDDICLLQMSSNLSAPLDNIWAQSNLPKFHMKNWNCTSDGSRCDAETTWKSRWKPESRLIHLRLRLAVIAVVRLVGCVCVALVVTLETRRNRERYKRGLFTDPECQDVPGKHPDSKADTIPYAHI